MYKITLGDVNLCPVCDGKLTNINNITTQILISDKG